MWWVLLLYFPTFASSINCDPGTFISDAICEDCPVGWSSPLSNALNCEECLAGTFSESKANECTSCPVGYVILHSGSHRCLACKKGMYQSETSGKFCINCQVGTFSNEIATGVCKECPVGFHQNFVGNYPVTSCNICPRGWSQTETGQELCKECDTDNCQYCDGYGIIQDNCQLCTFGQYSNRTAVCSQCPRGFEGGYASIDSEVQLQETGANRCVQCATGRTFSNNTCTDCSVGTYSDNYTCINCPTGYFRDSPVDTVQDQWTQCMTCPSGFSGGNGVNCEACAAGKYQEEDGRAACKNCKFPTKSGPASEICTEDCRIGFEVAPFQPECRACPAGYDGETMATCSLCPLGLVKPEIYGTCITCPYGRTSTDERTNCQICNPGKYANQGICTDCEQGYYMKQYNESIPPLYCEPAPPGGYQHESGADSYNECPPGTFTTRYNSSVCENCTIGRISKQFAVTCDLCPSGWGADSEGLSQCDLCPVEKINIDGYCQFCPKGTELQESVCVDCSQGQVQSISNGTDCFPCPTDTYALEDKTTCASCPDGQLANLIGPGSWICQDINQLRACSAGTYYAETECKNCPAGYISAGGAEECFACTATQIEVFAQTECQECRGGKKKVENNCESCEVGKYGTLGVCLDCARGRYQNEQTQEGCKECEGLSTTANKGAMLAADCKACGVDKVIVIDGICATCPPGKITETDGCQNCPGGQYTSSAETCQLCAIGKFAISGLPCTVCAAGRYQNEEGQEECKDCLAGVTATGCEVCASGTYGSDCESCPQGFWSLAGQESCSECSIGLYQDQQGKDSCIGCAPGKYVEELGAIKCKKCVSGKFQPSERAGICIDCLKGTYAEETGTIACKMCDPGTKTESEGSISVNDCLPCPSGTMEVSGICIDCPERFYSDEEKQIECKSCPNDQLSPRKSISLDACFSKEGLVTFVFGMKGDSKIAQSHTKNCEIRPNLVMLCPGCSCDDDSRNGFWDGPVCNECRRGFATRDCTAICPAYDGSHDSTMCNGNGFCWYGKFGDGLCYCGGKSDIDSTGENVVVDIRLCPKGKICAGYGEKEQTETNYLPRYYIMQYRQFSVFVLMLSRYTPQRGHMWFKRFPPSIAYENTCLACTGGYAKTPKTTVGFWNKDQDYEFFEQDLQTLNGFHGENCQHECALCLNGGRCHNVPHPYRLSYTIEDTFRPQREIFIPQTNCICSTMVFDPENMCCPNGFQPFVHYGLRLNPDPYTRFNRLPYLTSIKNEKRDYWINRDIYLETDIKYITPFAEPGNGLMWVANNNLLYSDAREDYIQMPYKDVGPYNKHVFYGVPREICRACPGLFGKGVRSAAEIIDTEEKAEEIWWDNAMGASARKCNGIGVCDFYKRPEETTVKFMGDASEFRLYERGKSCNALPIAGLQNKKTLQECIQFGQLANVNAEFIAFTEPYKGGQLEDMNGNYYINELVAATNARAQSSLGYASYLNGTQLLWTILQPSDSSKMPIPDSDSAFTIYSVSTSRCAAYSTCDTFINVPRFNIYKLKLGDGDDRLPKATFNRFDTCFTYTKDNNIEKFDLYLTQEYKQGLDPFLGGLCPKGHYCTEFEGVGYKEACPAGYYQPHQGVSRSLDSSQCSTATLHFTGCQENIATIAANDFTDNVCIRCPRNFFAPKGAAVCTECPSGTIKKISGQFTQNTPMLNIPTFHIAGYNPWYYIQNEQGYQSADCALVPPGIIHVPEANHYMTYDRPDFLAVMACPFGLSSRPGTFSIGGIQDLISLLVSRDDSVIQAPYIRFDQTYTIEEVTKTTCECTGYASISKTDCKKYLKDQGINTMLERKGPKGCFKHASRPEIGFFSDDGAEISSVALTYLCRSGVDNDALAGIFARANCFRCPGNSMTGPSSTTCTTCFANQLKFYAKEAVQKFAENTLPSLKLSTETDESPMEFSAKLPNYALVYKYSDQNYKANYIFVPRRSTDVTELSQADCYLACSSLESPFLIAVGILASDSSKCACSTETGTNTEYVWSKITGTIDEGGCADAAFDQFGEHSPAIQLDWYHSGLLTDCSQFLNDLGPYKNSNNGGWLVGPCEGGRTTTYDCDRYNWNSWAVYACKWGRRLRDSVGSGNQVIIVGSWSHVPKGCSVETNAVNWRVNIPHWNEGGSETEDMGNFKVVDSYPSWGGEALPLCSACQPGKRTQGGCQSCDPGMYTETPAQADKEYCQKCASGRYASKSGSTGCISCPIGFFQESTMSSSCNSCSVGFYQDIAGSVTCKFCLPGYYAEELSSSICAACAAGQFAPNIEEESCNKCSKGMYAYEAASHICKNCPRGYYGNEEGTDSCSECQPGKFQQAEKGETCSNCLPGTFSLKGAGGCSNCPQGYYQQGSGSGSCKRCKGGKACTQTSEGAPCPADRYQTVETWGVCKHCAAEADVRTGNTGCDWCSTDETTYGKSGTTCKNCPDKGWTPMIFVSDFGRKGHLHSCSQFYNEIGPYAGTAGNAGEYLQIACERGRTTDDNICDSYTLSYAKTACHWGRKLNEERIKDMTTTYHTWGISIYTPYHRCLYGGSLPLCNGFGGQRMVRTYITAMTTRTYTFKTTIWDTGSVKFEFLTDGSRGSISHSLYRGSRTDTIHLTTGERLAITLTYEQFILNFWWGFTSLFHHFMFPSIGIMTMEPPNLLITHRSNPVSSYCALN